jgi:D-glycero-D-manno-heptose 1,7-bisphosphate phosphatase
MKAVFLDRDGTIIEDAHYVRDPKDVVLVPQAVDGLKLLREKGYRLFVVSNQSGVGRGIISDEQFTAVHQKVCELLKAEGIEIDEYGYCFHRPEDECQCRKPQTGLIPKAFSGEKIDSELSFVVGDKDCDVELGEAAGMTGVLVLTGKGQETLKQMSQENKSPRTFSNLLEFASSL